MACSFVLPPVRSISLPSRLHPTSLKVVEAELNKLKIWEASISSIKESLGAETIQVGLVELAELYHCVDGLLHSSHTQQAILHHQDGKVLTETLDGSVTLLDTCGCARDMLLKMKEHVQDLQSSLRRRGGDSSMQRVINAYNTFRKKVKKENSNHIRALKREKSKFEFLPPLDLDPHLSMVVKVLREMSIITSVTFRFLLLFLSTPSPTRIKFGGGSLISKLMPMGLMVNEKGKKIMNEVGSVDVALCALHGHDRDTFVKDEVQTVQRKLEMLAVNINGLES